MFTLKKLKYDDYQGTQRFSKWKHLVKLNTEKKQIFDTKNKKRIASISELSTWKQK